jgi:hypothetical protein
MDSEFKMPEKMRNGLSEDRSKTPHQNIAKMKGTIIPWLSQGSMFSDI